ncbi:MAG: DUF6636 domain-containing protein [Cypionkella sp.]
MRRLALLLAFFPLSAIAAPSDGLYRNPAGPSLEITGATDQGFDFGLTSGAPDGGTECPEGEVDCLHVSGHADLTAKFFTYIDPDDATSRIFFADTNGGVKVVSTTGPLGTGTGNRAAMVNLPGVYAPQDSAASQAADAGERLVFFHSPTGNISCLFDVARVVNVRCDMAQLNRSFTTPPDDCDLEWGDSFSVAEGDRRGGLICHGDTVADPSAEVLDYGSTLSFGEVSCVSVRTGMTCQNAKGHGFALSRKSQSLF